MRERIYFKTATGAQEIQARQMRLHPRLRSLLVLIDGKHRAGELLDTLHAVGVTEAHFAELAELNLIDIFGSGGVAGNEAESPWATPSDDTPTEPAAGDVQTDAAAEDADAGTLQRRELYRFFNDHIRETLGLRGFMLQLQVEKAESVQDYQAIRDQFVTAVRKAKGETVATELQAELDQLLQTPG